MNIDFGTMAVLEEESHNETLGGGVYGSLEAASGEGGERREGGKRGRRPGRKAQSDKQDMKAKLERSRQSARECRARKKLRYQYLEELVADRERSVLALRKELDKCYTWNCELDRGRVCEDLQVMLQQIGVVKQEYYKWHCDVDQGRIPEGLEAVLQEIGVVKQEDAKTY